MIECLSFNSITPIQISCGLRCTIGVQIYFIIHLIFIIMTHLHRLANQEVKYFFGKRFVYYHGCWVLDEVCHNVITKKNAGSGKLYSDRFQSIK